VASTRAPTDTVMPHLAVDQLPLARVHIGADLDPEVEDAAAPADSNVRPPRPGRPGERHLEPERGPLRSTLLGPEGVESELIHVELPDLDDLAVFRVEDEGLVHVE
jgi:hypothetical protein